MFLYHILWGESRDYFMFYIKKIIIFRFDDEQKGNVFYLNLKKQKIQKSANQMVLIPPTIPLLFLWNTQIAQLPYTVYYCVVNAYIGISIRPLGAGHLRTGGGALEDRSQGSAERSTAPSFQIPMHGIIVLNRCSALLKGTVSRDVSLPRYCRNQLSPPSLITVDLNFELFWNRLWFLTVTATYCTGCGCHQYRLQILPVSMSPPLSRVIFLAESKEIFVIENHWLPATRTAIGSPCSR